MSERELVRIAGAVADGAAVAWDDVARRARSAEDLRLAGALRAIGERASSPAIGARAAPSAADGLLGAAGAFLVLLSSLQVAVGLGAFAWTVPEASAVPRLPVAISALVFTVAGAVLRHAGRQDRRAGDLGGFFHGLAAACAQPFLLAGGALGSGLAAFLPETFLPFWIWRFAIRFPRVVRLDRLASLVTAATVLSGTAGVVLFAVNAWARLAGDGTAVAPVLRPLLRGPSAAYWLVVAGLCVPAPFVALARSRAAGNEERARVRRFLAGLALGITPLFAEVMAEVLSPRFYAFMSRPEMRRAGAVVLYGLLLSVPVTTGRAVLASRVLATPRLAGRSLRIVLADRLPRFAVVVSAVLLALLVVRLSDRPLRDALHHPATPWLVGAGAAALVVAAVRRTRRGDAAATPHGLARTLVALGDELRASRTAAELEAALERAGARVAGAEQVRLLVRDERARCFAPVRAGVRVLPAGSALVALMEAAPDPLVVAPGVPRSLLDLLPEEDRLWLADADAAAAIPLPRAAGGCDGILLLGPRAADEPWDAAALAAAAALVSPAALALERLASATFPAASQSPGDDDRPAGECRACGRVAAAPEGPCPCGGRFVEAPIPCLLAGKFRLERVLGRGGMGVVYRAEDVALGRRVALKTLPQLAGSALLRLRFEARAMARVAHPGLATIYGAETWRGVPVLVVELMPGATLADRLARAPLSVRETVALGLELAAALEAMHAQGLLHRDLKPANVGFDAAGRAKLLDFGLAHLVGEPAGPASELAATAARRERLTLTGHLVGTPAYLPPEAFVGDPPSPAMDLWALHLSLWECLAGRLPDAVLGPGVGGGPEIPDVRAVVPGCPEPLALLLARGLDEQPHRRRESASAVRAALAALDLS